MLRSSLLRLLPACGTKTSGMRFIQTPSQLKKTFSGARSFSAIRIISSQHTNSLLHRLGGELRGKTFLSGSGPLFVTAHQQHKTMIIPARRSLSSGSNEKAQEEVLVYINKSENQLKVCAIENPKVDSRLNFPLFNVYASWPCCF
jgi:hypothetical protein